MRYLVTLFIFLLTVGSTPAQEFSHSYGKGAQPALTQALQWVSAPPADAPNLPYAFSSSPDVWAFTNFAEKTVLPTSTTNDVWLRFTLAATPDPQSWIVRIPGLNTRKISLYDATAHGFWAVQSAGASLAHSAWTRGTRTPSFEVVTKTVEKSYYLRFENDAPVTERPEILSHSDFADGAARIGVLLGLMLGMFAMLMLACMAAYVVARNIVFISLAVFVLAVLMYYLVQMGYGGWRIWPGSAYLNQVMPWTAPLLAMAAGCWFFAQASHASDISKLTFRFLCLVALVSLGLALFRLTGIAHLDRRFLNAWTALVLSAVVVSMLRLSFRGVRGNVWLLAGLMPIAGAAASRLAHSYGWVSQVEFTQVISIFMTLFGLAWLFVVMVWRSRAALLSSELALALNESDTASGLIQSRVALIRLPQMLRRATQLKLGCGVIMLRWLNYTQLMSSLGPDKQHEMLKHLGHVLNHVARDIDTAARLDDGHFIILVEGPVSRNTLSLLSTQILTACIRASDKFSQPNPFNLHLAIWQATLMPMSDAEVMESLKTRLNQMSFGTKRPVQFVDAPSSDQTAEVEQDATLRREGLLAKIDAIEASPSVRSVLLAEKSGE
jgi:GGDEF domain-containing protein